MDSDEKAKQSNDFSDIAAGASASDYVSDYSEVGSNSVGSSSVQGQPQYVIKTENGVSHTLTDEYDDRQCWVCFASDEDDPTAEWTHPCKCRGATKWVHQDCIQRWIDEKQKGNISIEVECPQCSTKYIIQFPDSNFFVFVLDSVDKFVQTLCPVVAGAFCAASLFWTSVSFGAVSLMQVVGHDQSLRYMEKCDPLFLLIALPLIPTGLVLGKMIRWEEPVLEFLRAVVPKIPLSRYFLPLFCSDEQETRSSSSLLLPPFTDPVSLTRIFCSALFFPTIASFIGSVMYEKYESQFKRTCLGGITFIALKGALRVYHKQHNYIRATNRIIMDHADSQ